MDIAVELPINKYGHVVLWSGTAASHGITTLSNVINLDYQGNIKVMLVNTGQEFFSIHQGMRIAQLLATKTKLPLPTEVKELSSTARGDKGFGSTGLG